MGIVRARSNRGGAAVDATWRRKGLSRPRRRPPDGWTLLLLQLLVLALAQGAFIPESSSLGGPPVQVAGSGLPCPLLDVHPGSGAQQGVFARVPCVEDPPSRGSQIQDGHLESRGNIHPPSGSSRGGVWRQQEDDGVQARSYASSSSGSTVTDKTTINGDCYRCLPRALPVGDRSDFDDGGRKGGLRRPDSDWSGGSLRGGRAASGPAHEAGFGERETGGIEGALAAGGDASLWGAPLTSEAFPAMVMAVRSAAEGEAGHAISSAAATALLSPSGLVGEDFAADHGGNISTEGASQDDRDAEDAESDATAPEEELLAAVAVSPSELLEKPHSVARALQQAEPTSTPVEPDPVPFPAPSSSLAPPDAATPVATETGSIFAPVTPLTFAPAQDIVTAPFARITWAPVRPLTFAPLIDLVPPPDPTPTPFTPPETPEPSPYPIPPTPDPTFPPVTPETDPPTAPPTDPPTDPPTAPPVLPPTPAPLEPETSAPLPVPTPRPTAAPWTPSTPRDPPATAPSPRSAAPVTPPTPNQTASPVTAPSPQPVSPFDPPPAANPEQPATTPSPTAPVPTADPETTPSPTAPIPTIEPSEEPANPDRSTAPAAPSGEVITLDPSTAPVDALSGDVTSLDPSTVPASSAPIPTPPTSPTYSVSPAVSSTSPPARAPVSVDSTETASKDDEKDIATELIIGVVAGVISTVVGGIVLVRCCGAGS